MKKKLMLWTIIFIIPVISGCTAIYDRHAKLELNKGRSFETARFNQTLNADPEINVDPIQGLDGNVANYAIDNYHKNFQKAQSTTNVININAGGK